MPPVSHNPTQLSSVDNMNRINALQPKLLQLKQDNALMARELQDRDTKFVKREKEYREIIGELQDQIKLRVEFSEEGIEKM